MRVDRSVPMSHLSQEGINLARSIDDLYETYDLVITSTLQRAMETAVAMGQAITETDSRLNTYGQAIEDEVDYLLSFEIISLFLNTNRHFQEFARKQTELYIEILERLPDHGRALLISHGGVIDIPLVAIFPDEDHGKWGDHPFDYCEGFRIYYDSQKGEFVGYELLRIQNRLE